MQIGLDSTEYNVVSTRRIVVPEPTDLTMEAAQ